MAQVEANQVVREILNDIVQAEAQCRQQIGLSAENLMDVQFWRGSVQAMTAMKQSIAERLKGLEEPAEPAPSVPEETAQ